MKKFLVMTLIIAGIIGLTSIDTAYAQELPLQFNADIDLEQSAIIAAIGLVVACITAYNGWKKSGLPFEAGKFLIAVKRTAKISIPAAAIAILAIPEPTLISYAVIAIGIIIGESKQHSKKTVETQTTIPKLGPVDAKYQTNFVKGAQGNTLPYGDNLWIKRVGAKSYVTAILRDSNEKILQVDQSHPSDEDGNIETTRLEMLAKDGSPLPRGLYSVQSQSDEGTSDATGIKRDVFHII